MSLPDVLESIDGQRDSVLRSSLSRPPPDSYDEYPIDMSGMDCFIAVIRHICSLAGHNLIDHIATDDALKFVRADYSASTEEERNRVQEHRFATFKKVERLVGKQKPTFEDIVESEHVCQRLWSRDGLRLFLAVLYRDDDTSPWNSAFDHKFESVESLVDWRLQDHGTIEEVLTETKFGVKTLSNGGEALFLFGNPSIVRIRLASKVNRATWKGGAFAIGHVRCFSYNGIPRKTVRTQRDGTTVISDSVLGGIEDEIVYYLIAVVRLRNPGEDQDYARLYDIESRNILPHGNQGHMGTFSNKLWSLSHLDHDHMLYYARADNRPKATIRLGTEIAARESDQEGDFRGERQMDGLWQKRYVLRNLPDFMVPIDEEGFYGP